MTKPNIVWIFPDEWRHDAFGHVGNDVVQTPNVDALAARGTSFRGARCESPVCQSARASLLTLRYPAQHGLSDNEHLPSTKGAFPAADVPNFLHSLRAAGYRTAELGKMHFGRDSLGAGVAAWGFDDAWQEHDKYVLWRMDTPYTRHLKARGLWEEWENHNSGLLPWLPSLDGKMQPNPRHRKGAPDVPDKVPDHEMLDVFIGDRACDYLRERSGDDQPFFLWVAPIGPHPPFDAATRFTERYDPMTVPLGDTRLDAAPDNAWGRYLDWNLKHIGCGSWDEGRWRHVARQYYGMCTQVDDVVGRIVATLAETGLDRDTWIVFSSDHGELLGDHGLFSKRVFYDSSVRVPQLVVPPVGKVAPRVVEEMTQAFDAVATILDLAGADLPGDDVPARSLLPALRGEPVGRDIVFSEIAGFAMAETATQKVVVHEETGEVGALYELSDDPGERMNLVEDPAAVGAFAELVERVDALVGVSRRRA